MWKCKDCDEIFDEPGYPEDDTIICPICGGDDLGKWKECPQCMRVMPTGEDYCDTCIGEVAFAIKLATRDYDSDLVKIVMEQMLEG